MKNIREHLEDWFQEMIYKYPWIKFMYEVTGDGKEHRICVYPRGMIDESDAYCEDEVLFSNSLDRCFPNNNVLFSTEDELFSCSEKADIYQEGTTRLDCLQDLIYIYS